MEAEKELDGTRMRSDTTHRASTLGLIGDALHGQLGVTHVPCSAILMDVLESPIYIYIHTKPLPKGP